MTDLAPILQQLEALAAGQQRIEREVGLSVDVQSAKRERERLRRETLAMLGRERLAMTISEMG